MVKAAPCATWNTLVAPKISEKPIVATSSGQRNSGAIVGPSLGAFVLSSGADIEWAFYAFAVPALLGAFAAGAVPRARTVAA